MEKKEKELLKKAIRLYVKTRIDYQAMRKATDNRLGRKTNGKMQNVPDREFNWEDQENFNNITKEFTQKEKEIEKMLLHALRKFPIYTQWLNKQKGIGTISAGWIIGWIDIEKATNASKIIQYCGLNPGMVRGKKRIESSKFKESMGEIVSEIEFEKQKDYIYQTNELIRGDKATPGYVLPYNKPLKTALVGVMAPGFIMSKNHYALEYYYPYKTRLEQETNKVMHYSGGKTELTAWKDVSAGHRDRAALRYMTKQFLQDLYAAWRKIEGLPVRPPYAEEYLGKVHVA